MAAEKPFTVLGIETSCDDTAVGIVNSEGKILSSAVHSQHSLIERFGGVVPSLAMKSHQENLGIVIDQALLQAGMTDLSEIDGIAVTRGPGLAVCLRVGIREAQRIATMYKKPFVLVHHHEAHCLIGRKMAKKLPSLSKKKSYFAIPESNVKYPFLALLASGGHTSILCCYGLGHHVVIGTTLDDAIGEAFDKGARLLGILTGTKTGGAIIEDYAKNGDVKIYGGNLPLPMLHQRNCDFSFAGLKNAFRLLVHDVKKFHGIDPDFQNAPSHGDKEIEREKVLTLPNIVTNHLCAAFQDTAFRHLDERVSRAVAYIHDQGIPIRQLVVVGGVASNFQLRNVLGNLIQRANKDLRYHKLTGEWEVFFPHPSLCVDNGIMVAWTGIEMFEAGISHDPNEFDLEPIPRWPIGELLPESVRTFRTRKNSKLIQ